jgi:hypothetical protein
LHMPHTYAFRIAWTPGFGLILFASVTLVGSL